MDKRRPSTVGCRWTGDVPGGASARLSYEGVVQPPLLIEDLDETPVVSDVLRLQSAKNRKQSLEIQIKAWAKALNAPKVVVKNSKGKNRTNGSVSVGFGRVNVVSKETRWFSIRNKEATPLHISRISVTGPHAEIFRIASASNMEIPPGETLRFEVSCKPVKARDFSATFIIRSKYGNKKVPAIRVKGKGVALPSKGIAGSSGKPKADRVGE